METLKLDDSSYTAIWEKAVSRLQKQADWWSHRELSDPGVTLLEMWAVLCDMQSFYLDQIQESHYRGYLKLLGIPADQGSCARVRILFSRVAEDCVLPAGTKMLADTMIFEIPEETELTDNQICGLFREEDQYHAPTMLFARKFSFFLKSPEALFSILLEKPLKEDRRFSLYILLDEKQERNPAGPGFSLVRLTWEYRTERGWRAAQVLRDETAGLFYSGCVSLKTDCPMAVRQDGKYEIRCRVAEGEYDALPILYRIGLNTVEAVQRDTRCCCERGRFSSACRRIQMKSYLARTGRIRVFAGQGEGLWREITEECLVDPPVTDGGQSRYVYFRGDADVRFVCAVEGFEEEYLPCPITGVTSQRIVFPWKNILRDSVELMLAQDEEGLYREYRRTDPEEIGVPAAWHWGEGESEIVFGDGRHGDIPKTSEKGLLLTSLALFEGEEGNVSIGRIRQPEKPELFPDMCCTNLLTGEGGRDRKSFAEQFRKAREAMVRPGRIVTGEDAEKLARSVPGLLVREAKAEWKGNRLVVTIRPKVPLGEYCRERYRDMAEAYLEQYRPAGIEIRVEIASAVSA